VSIRKNSYNVLAKEKRCSGNRQRITLFFEIVAHKGALGSRYCVLSGLCVSLPDSFRVWNVLLESERIQALLRRTHNELAVGMVRAKAGDIFWPGGDQGFVGKNENGRDGVDQLLPNSFSKFFVNF